MLFFYEATLFSKFGCFVIVFLSFSHSLFWKQFKILVAQKFEAEPEQLVLIFAGKIMKDTDTLKMHNIKDNLTVHLVIKSPTRTNEAPARAPADVRQTPFGLNQFGGLAGMEALGAGSNTFMDLQARMQNELLNNGDMLRSLMDNPLVQQMMNNPETMRQLITSNPQMQDLMQRNPEISHMLNNPDLLRQTMELARNPSMLQELMRSHDRAMSNLESVPGGYSALQRIYRDIQEPMMNAATESFGRNPFAGLVEGGGASAAGVNPQQGTENRNPLPNPWGAGTGNRTGSAGGAGGQSNNIGAGSNARSGDHPPNNVLNTPAMRSLLQQMADNPALMQNLLNAPYTRSMMESMSQDPEMASRLLGTSPLLANNPQLQDQMRQMMPQFMAQMQNPDVMNMLTNPEAINAILQIQQGMEQLRSAAPNLVGTLGIPPPPPGINSAATGTGGVATSGADPASGDGSNTNNGSGSNSTSPVAAVPNATTPGTAGTPALAPGGGPNAQLFNDFMMRMLNGMSNNADTTQPPEVRYQSQLEQLASMGFANRDANLQGKHGKGEREKEPLGKILYLIILFSSAALIATFGDINAAVERLLSLNQLSLS